MPSEAVLSNYGEAPDEAALSFELPQKRTQRTLFKSSSFPGLHAQPHRSQQEFTKGGGGGQGRDRHKKNWGNKEKVLKGVKWYWEMCTTTLLKQQQSATILIQTSCKRFWRILDIHWDKLSSQNHQDIFITAGTKILIFNRRTIFFFIYCDRTIVFFLDSNAKILILADYLCILNIFSHTKWNNTLLKVHIKSPLMSHFVL